MPGEGGSSSMAARQLEEPRDLPVVEAMQTEQVNAGAAFSS